MVSYGSLVNKNGTIYNIQTGQGYSTPAALAADLGVPVGSIQWGSIQSNPNWSPTSTFGGTPPTPTPTPQPNPTPTPTPTPTPQSNPTTGTPANTGTTNTNPATPQFYKPGPGQPGYDANNPQAVYDSAGNYVSLAQYQQATGQTGVPTNEINWQYVTQGVPTAGFGTFVNSFDPNSIPGLAAVWGQLSPADKAFIQSAYTVVKSQYTSGGSAVVDPQTWAKALQVASTDPSIQATYGDALKEGTQALAFNIGQLTNNYAAQQAAQQVGIDQQKKALMGQIQQTGQAYSGFGQLAKNQLATNQNSIIQSSRSQLQQNLQNLGSDYESKFGSTALAGQPSVSAGGYSYTPVGGIIGTNTQGQTNAETALAQQKLSLLPSVSTSGVAS